MLIIAASEIEKIVTPAELVYRKAREKGMGTEVEF